MNKLHPIAKKLGYKTNKDFYNDFPTKEDYIKKYPDGGDPTTIAKKDVMSLPGAVTQTTGNTGAPVVDPYSFSIEQGVTTLKPNQWKLLSADQQQTIWRQAFDAAGIKQIGDNQFSATQSQANMFANGGEIFSQVSGAIAPIVNFIPGVGPIINAGLGIMNMGFDKEETPILKDKEILPMNQGLYGMAKGGNLAGRKKYFNFEAEGGELILGDSDIKQTNKSSVGGIIDGASHKNGGVKGNTGDYIISDRFGVDGSYMEDNPNSLAKKATPIMKAISKTEKRTGDNIDRLTVGMLKNKIKNFKILNDKFLEQEKVKETFAAGGPLSGLIDFSKDAIYDYGINQNLANDYDNPYIEPIVPDVNTSRFSSHTDVNNGITGAGGVQPRVAATGRGAQIVPPINDEKLGGLTGLDIAGMGVSALGAGFQFANTINEFNKNKELNPNINYYNDISARAENTYQESLDTLNREKMQSARDINESYSPLLTTQQSNSVNVDRAVKANAYANRSKNIGMSNLSYDSAIAQGKQGLAGLQMQGDTLDAQGKFQVNEAKQMDLANFYTQMGINAETASGLALQSIQIANKAKSQSQALILLKDSMPNFSLEQLNNMLQIIYKK